MNSQSNIPIYQSEDGQTKIQTRLENETVWLTIDQMVELDENMVCANFAHTTKHGAIENKGRRRFY